MCLVAYLVGWLGIHRKMMGHKNWWIQLVTIGGLCIWSFADLINLLAGNMKMADGRELT